MSEPPFDHAEYAWQLLEMAADDEAGSDIEHFHLAKAQAHAMLGIGQKIGTLIEILLRVEEADQ